MLCSTLRPERSTGPSKAKVAGLAAVAHSIATVMGVPWMIGWASDMLGQALGYWAREHRDAAFSSELRQCELALTGQGLSVAETLGNPTQRAWRAANLGIAYLSHHSPRQYVDVRRAILHLQAALGLRDGLPPGRGRMVALDNLADAYRTLADLAPGIPVTARKYQDAARRWAQEALDVVGHTDLEWRARVLHHLLVILLRIGQSREETDRESILTVLRELKGLYEVVDPPEGVHCELAGGLRACGLGKEAMRWARYARSACISWRPDYHLAATTEWLLALRDAHASAGEIAEVAAELQTEMRATATGDPRIIANAYLTLGSVQLEYNDQWYSTLQAVEHFHLATTSVADVADQAIYGNSLYPACSQLAQLAYAAGDEDKVFSALQLGDLPYPVAAQSSPRLSSAPVESFKSEAAVVLQPAAEGTFWSLRHDGRTRSGCIKTFTFEDMTSLYATDSDSEIQELANRLDKYNQMLNHERGDPGGRSLKDWEEAAKSLIGSWRERRAGWYPAQELCANVSSQVGVPLIHAGLLGDYRKALRGLWSGTITRISTTLGRRLFEPLVKEIPSDVKRLAITPRGLLRLLPVHLAEVEGSRLFSKYDLAFRPRIEQPFSAPVVARVNRPDAHDIVVIADPSKDLPWAQLEAFLVARHFGLKRRDVYAGQRATPDCVKEAFLGKRVIYAACHGVFDLTDPQSSGLLLADSKLLTIRDIMNSDLSGIDLVVLSACNTARVSPAHFGMGLLGLADAFLAAGARSVCASLWAVPDVSTAVLMKDFIERVFPSGAIPHSQPVAPSEALQQAQREMSTMTMPALVSRLEGWISEIGDAMTRDGEEWRDVADALSDLTIELRMRLPIAQDYWDLVEWGAFQILERPHL